MPILSSLKKLDFSKSEISLAILKEYKVKRISKYTIKYVPIDERLENRLLKILKNKIEISNHVSDYTFDSPEPEGDQLSSIDYNQTDFYNIYNQLTTLNPEVDKIDDVDELVNSTKAYMIVMRDASGIKLIGFKTIPENWKMKKNKGLIPLLYRENRFEDLEDENIFSISSTIDFIFFNEKILIMSKKNFEQALNFRDGMIAKAVELYNEVSELRLFINLDLLKSHVGNNQRYLRKIAIIKKLGYYRDTQFLSKIQEKNKSKGWGIQFKEGQIIFTVETIDTILTLLQNKRLFSELTQQDFDVDGKIDLVN